MAGNETLGASFQIDTTNLKAGLSAANRLIRESESEFRAAAAGMDDWTKSEDGLNKRISSLNNITEIQRKKVDALESQYEELIANGLDPTSKEAVELRTKINNETAALNKNEAEAAKLSKALEELGDDADKAGDNAEDMGGKFEGLKAAGGIAVGAIAAVGAAAAGAVTAFLGLAESTRESRNEMAKLTTSFETAGLSAENAENTFNELYGVLGDEGRATETASFLAKYADNEAELAAQTRILTGVFAQYGDSIPTEGLAEGIAATISMGETQGVLADALEWQGVNLDSFNESLAACTSEQEREALITQTLNGLYGEAADKYNEVNAEIIASREAQANLNSALNELGAIAEPIMTTIKTLAADLLTSITPFVSLIGEGLTGALSGADGAAATLAEGLSGLLSSLLDKIVEIAPFIIDTVLELFPTLLSAVLGQLPNIIQTLLTMVTEVILALAEMLPEIIPTIIDTVILVAETLLDNIDMIIDAGIKLLIGLADGLIKALPKLIDKIPVIIEKLISAVTNNLPKLVEAGIQLIISLAGGLIKAIPQLVKQIPQIITSIVSGFETYYSKMGDIGKDLIKGLWNGIKDMTAWIKKKIKGFGSDVLDGLKSFFGIKSPSRLMADVVGKNLALGIGKGFEDNIGEVNKEITDAMNFDDPNFSGGSGGVRSVGRGVVVNQNNYYSQAHSRIELYKTKQATAAAVRLAIAGA